MGLETLPDPLTSVRDAIEAKDERIRKESAKIRERLYRDDYKDLLRRRVGEVFNELATRAGLEPFIPFVGGSAFLKRIADELGRALYARPPVRRLLARDGSKVATGQQDALCRLNEEMQTDDRMDTVARLLTPSRSAGLFPRYVNGRGMRLDVLTPSMVTVVPVPSSPLEELAVIYDAAYDSDGRVTRRVVWDDKRSFAIDGNSRQVADAVEHDFGLIPVYMVHHRGRVGTYWDTTTGEDLVAETFFEMLLDLITVRKLKAQSHLQLVYTGDSEGFYKDQVTDEHSVLMAGGQGSLSLINLESNPDALIRTKEASATAVAANYGVSRDRLNQKTGTPGDDVALQERVAELARVMVGAERGVFRILKQVSREHPEYKLDQDLELSVDLGQVHNRVNRKDQLEIRREEMRQGARSIVDSILEDNPELGGDRWLAMEHVREKARENAEAWLYIRAGNMSLETSYEDPGLTAQQNGANGPAVRDGKMTRDEAAKQATEGKRQADDGESDDEEAAAP